MLVLGLSVWIDANYMQFLIIRGFLLPFLVHISLHSVWLEPSCIARITWAWTVHFRLELEQLLSVPRVKNESSSWKDPAKKPTPSWPRYFVSTSLNANFSIHLWLVFISEDSSPWSKTAWPASAGFSAPFHWRFCFIGVLLSCDNMHFPHCSKCGGPLQSQACVAQVLVPTLHSQASRWR